MIAGQCRRASALVVLGWMSVAAAELEPYSCGPFLLQPGPERMTVVVDHEAPVTATLSYRRADGEGMAQERRHPTAARHHMFALDGLAPDTAYRYRVTSGARDRDSGERVFRTLPAQPAVFRVLAVGDVRSYPQDWHRVSRRIFEHEPDALFMIGTGDYPADGTQYDQWIEQFFEPGRDLLGRVPMWPAIGNHERTKQYPARPPDDGADDGADAAADAEEGSHYFSLFELPGNEHWYRVDYAHLTLLIIDSNSQMAPGHEQYEWIRDQLASTRGPFTVVAFHHPPITSGPHGALNDDGTPREWPMAQGREFLMPLFEQHGVDLVLNGHDHFYERSYSQGTYYVVTGGGGAPLYAVGGNPNPHQQVARSVHHYVALDITSDELILTAIDAEGEEFDRFVIAARSSVDP